MTFYYHTFKVLITQKKRNSMFNQQSFFLTWNSVRICKFAKQNSNISLKRTTIYADFILYLSLKAAEFCPRLKRSFSCRKAVEFSFIFYFLLVFYDSLDREVKFYSLWFTSYVTINQVSGIKHSSSSSTSISERVFKEAFCWV